MVEAFKGAYRCGAYRYDAAFISGQLFNEGAWHGYELAVHLMLADGVGLYGLECSGSDMECDLPAWNAEPVDPAEYCGGEVQSGCGGGHGAVDTGIDCLVVA